MKPSIGVWHYRKTYSTARLPVLGLSRKPKFAALVMLYFYHLIGVFGDYFGIMVIHLQHPNANLVFMDLNLSCFIVKFERPWRDYESYNSVLERPGATDSTCICSLGCLLDAQMKL